jgi:GDPmannose 4,6-dehydratase
MQKIMWKRCGCILQQDKPEDFVIATGVTTSIRDFVRMAFAEIGVELAFQGEGVDEKAFVVSASNPDYQVEVGKEVLSIDERYFRPTEVDLLLGDPTKAMTKLNWQPKYDLAALVKDMMSADIDLFRRDQLLAEGGHLVMNYFE